MAYRCQRTDLRTCLLSLFQWHPAQICSSDRYFTACHLPVRRNHLEYVSLFLSRQHVMGRTSQRRNHGNTLCIRFLEPRASTTGTFCRRNGRRRRRRISGRRYQRSQYNRLYGYYLTNPGYGLCNASISKVILAVNNLTEIASRMMPKNLRMM